MEDEKSSSYIEDKKSSISWRTKNLLSHGRQKIFHFQLKAQETRAKLVREMVRTANLFKWRYKENSDMKIRSQGMKEEQEERKKKRQFC